jgi:regulator of telomere elongation helicase 1
MALWCFDPGFAFKKIMRLGTRSVILTSGTLSPLESFGKELKL